MTRRLTLTFDNGPWAGATERVLDVLRERGLKASFFVIGERLDDPACRAAAERAHAEGHWIGNHTLTHGPPLGREGGAERAEREIGEAQKRLGSLAHPRKLFRPNGGGALGPHLLSPGAVDYLRRHRFTVVTWTSAPGDWQPPHSHWTDNARADLARDDWTVLVLHDRFIAPIIGTLEEFCDHAAAEGVEIVQDFPAACLPIEAGEIRGPLAEIAAGA